MFIKFRTNNIKSANSIINKKTAASIISALQQVSGYQLPEHLMKYNRHATEAPAQRSSNRCQHFQRSSADTAAVADGIAQVSVGHAPPLVPATPRATSVPIRLALLHEQTLVPNKSDYFTARESTLNCRCSIASSRCLYKYIKKYGRAYGSRYTTTTRNKLTTSSNGTKDEHILLLQTQEAMLSAFRTFLAVAAAPASPTRASAEYNLDSK
ncbi:hypothetical protein CBL_00780 [Carabus blaptoides fortunei]